MPPKCFYDTRRRCMAGKRIFRISPYSDDLLFFSNTLKWIPSHKYCLRTDLVQGAGGAACPAVYCQTEPAAGHHSSWAMRCPAALKRGTLQTGSHRKPACWLLDSPSPTIHSILRAAEATEESVQDHKAFLLFWDKLSSFYFLSVLTSLPHLDITAK